MGDNDSEGRKMGNGLPGAWYDKLRKILSSPSDADVAVLFKDYGCGCRMVRLVKCESQGRYHNEVVAFADVGVSGESQSAWVFYDSEFCRHQVGVERILCQGGEFPVL